MLMQELLTRAHNTNDQADIALRSLLSQEEVELYEAGRQAMHQFDCWRRTGSSTIQKNLGSLKRKTSNSLVVASDESLTRRRSDQV